MLAAIFDLNGPQRFVEWGWLRITVPNLIVVGLLVVAFFVAVRTRMSSR
jgi:hypothetical protein